MAFPRHNLLKNSSLSKQKMANESAELDGEEKKGLEHMYERKTQITEVEGNDTRE